MPLPAPNTPWPPPQLRQILRAMAGWDAWYTGDPEKLALHYGATGPNLIAANMDHLATYRGGLVGRVARWFWGQPQRSLQMTKLHVPVAADLCQVSADLLFAKPVTLTVDHSATQTRLASLADDGLHDTLAEAAEIAAALGGVYLRVTWDRSVVPDQPFLTAVHADGAAPEFRWGRLVAVTFWRVANRDRDAVLRHLERHELDASGEGVIAHGLYLGSDDSLGRPVPLTESPVTAGLAALVDENGAIPTRSPGLAVVYAPNARPQRIWRADPLGASLGRPDLDGVEHLMDALDETYTSWMRDIRLGKARVFLAKSMLDQLPNGQGVAWDADQEIYAALNLLAPPGNTGNGLPIQAEQFAIRYAEHAATAAELLAVILRTAGYSAQTFGMDPGDARASNLTATEVQARERRSYLTRDRKIRLWRPAVAAIATKLLWTDRVVFGSRVDPNRPVNVVFADSAQESALALAQTAQALSAAGAASTRTLVQLVHPAWDADQVAGEADLIATERAGTPLPDPTTMTGADGFPTG